MTLQQLKYIIGIVNSGSINEAAKRLFISQPSLSKAVRELENELNFEIFRRSSKGISLSLEGTEFLSYARQVVEQAELLEQRYLNTKPLKRQFSISTQHYAFAVNAFVNLIKKLNIQEYEWTLRETRTFEIIEDVHQSRSDLGILYLNDFNRQVISKLLKKNDLCFHPLFRAEPHVFVSSAHPLARRRQVLLEDLEDYPCLSFEQGTYVYLWKGHPLANKEEISIEELEEYPYLSFEQGEHNSFYFSEEILSTIVHRKEIHVSDRATLFNLLIGLNGYTICSGVLSEDLNGSNIISIPLKTKEYMLVGWIDREQSRPSRSALLYIEELKRVITEYGYEVIRTDD